MKKTLAYLGSIGEIIISVGVFTCVLSHISLSRYWSLSAYVPNTWIKLLFTRLVGCWCYSSALFPFVF